MEKISKEIKDYINRANHRETVEYLIQIITEADPDIQMDMKWRAITFTKNDNWHHWICNITDTKKSVGLFFHKGSLLIDPKKMLIGEGKALRKMEISNTEDIDKNYIQSVLKDAIEKQLQMPPDINM